jgi:hypothetical protein
VTDKIESNEVIDEEAVGSVHPITLTERIVDALPTARTFVAVMGLTATMVVCICVLFSENPKLADYRSGAWAIIAGFAGACVTYFFGDGKKAD